MQVLAKWIRYENKIEAKHKQMCLKKSKQRKEVDFMTKVVIIAVVVVIIGMIAKMMNDKK